MESHYNYKHLVENKGYKPLVFFGFEAYACRLPKTSNK